MFQGKIRTPVMSDELADSTARLQELLERVMKEKDPEKYDELSAEIRRVLDERETLKQRLAAQKNAVA